MDTTETANVPAPGLGGPGVPAVGAPPASPAAQVQKALDALNHPGNLDLQSRLAALENALRVLIGQLLPLLPRE